MNKNLDIIKISGSIGMIKLKKDNKEIFFFHDDHSNKKYCSSNESIFLYDLIENIIKTSSKYKILLEEPFINNYSDIKFLWNDTPHIIKFRNFYKKITAKCSKDKICYVFPFDIRLILTNISIDELLSNIDNIDFFNNYDITIYDYFTYILYIFDYINYRDNKDKFTKCDKNIFFIKKVFNIFIKSDYYIKLKFHFDNIYNKFIKPNKSLKLLDFLNLFKNNIYYFNFGFPFEYNENENEYNFLDYFDKLINGIMEFYAFILIIGLETNNIIIYSGYYHSYNLVYIFKKYYNYNQIYKVGHTEGIEKINDDNIFNCLNIDKKIFNK